MGNVRSNLSQLQLKCQYIIRTHGHTRNDCPCDFRKPQLGALRRLLESFWPDWNSICDSCQKKLLFMQLEDTLAIDVIILIAKQHD